METIEYNGVTLHRWNCGPSTFLARPELGARLMNWNLRMSDGHVRDIIHWPENADFSNFAKVRGGNPILFPFSARTFNKGKLGEWSDQDGNIRPMPMHGFARDGAFTITEIDEHGFTAELQPTETDHDAYPFDYRFTVRYAFAETALKVFLKLENLGEHPIQWSAGHHFYFTLPWHKELKREDYRAQIPANISYTQASDGSLKAGKAFDPTDTLDAISDRIFSELTDELTTFGTKTGDEDIAIRFLPESETNSIDNTIVTWRESEDSPFYCVEPWMGPPNAPEHRKGLHTVQPGKSATFGVEIALQS